MYSPILISTDGKRDINTLNEYIGEKNIISSTYDSASIVIELLNQNNFNNVIVIIDEFHNLSENNINNSYDPINRIINSNNYHKIFLSAKPLKNFMNIPSSSIYRLSWKDAIDKKYILDFNITIPDKNETFDSLIDLIKKICDKQINIPLVIKAYFILKGLLFNGNKKCICYITTTRKTLEILLNMKLFI